MESFNLEAHKRYVEEENQRRLQRVEEMKKVNIPNVLSEQFNNVVTRKQYETSPHLSKEEKLTIMQYKLGIPKHGRGKRKKKKKGGKK